MAAKKDLAKGQINFSREGIVVRRAWASGKIGGTSVAASAVKPPFMRGRYTVIIDNIEAGKRENAVQARGELHEVLEDLPENEFAEVAARVVKKLSDLIWDKVKPGDTMNVQKAKGTLRFLNFETDDDDLIA